ncbi:MAG: nuclear transport factor 2 family protein [Pseudomonadota bacterium]
MTASWMSRIAVAVLLVSACRADADVDAPMRRAIEAACDELIDQYAIARDRFDAESYAAVFADDGVLVLPDATYRGRAAIAARLRQGAGKTRSQHFMSSREIRVIDSRKATGLVYAMIFIEALPPAVSADQALTTDGPLAIGAYHDEYRLTERGWKIARREFRTNFVWENP